MIEILKILKKVLSLIQAEIQSMFVNITPVLILLYMSLALDGIHTFIFIGFIGLIYTNKQS